MLKLYHRIFPFYNGNNSDSFIFFLKYNIIEVVYETYDVILLAMNVLHLYGFDIWPKITKTL